MQDITPCIFVAIEPQFVIFDSAYLKAHEVILLVQGRQLSNKASLMHTFAGHSRIFI